MTVCEMSQRQLGALLRQPEAWGALDDQELTALLTAQCRRYGEAADGDRVHWLFLLYKHAVERLDRGARADILASVSDLVADGRCQAIALFPFLQADPDVGVCSTAAMEFAQDVPLQDGDPMTGPKLLAQMAVTTTSEGIRAAIFAGLLLLGDRRVLPVIDRCWELMTDMGLNVLAQANSGIAYASTAEFYLRRMEATVDDPDQDASFGAAAAGLCRMPLCTPSGEVLDVERRFPMTDAGEIRILGSWTFRRFGKLIRPRLKALLAREREPKVLPTVMEAWR